MSLSIGTVPLTLTKWVLAGLWLLPGSLLALRRLASVRLLVDLRPWTKAAVFMPCSMCMDSVVAAGFWTPWIRRFSSYGAAMDARQETPEQGLSMSPRRRSPRSRRRLPP